MRATVIVVLHENHPMPIRKKTAPLPWRFRGYWFNESGDCTPDVPDDLRAMMEAMGGTVEIDEYR